MPDDYRGEFWGVIKLVAKMRKKKEVFQLIDEEG